MRPVPGLRALQCDVYCPIAVALAIAATAKRQWVLPGQDRGVSRSRCFMPVPASLVVRSRCTAGVLLNQSCSGMVAVQAKLPCALYVQRVSAGPELHTLSPIVGCAWCFLDRFMFRCVCDAVRTPCVCTALTPCGCHDMQIGPYWTSNPGQNGTKLQMFLTAPGALLHMHACT